MPETKGNAMKRHLAQLSPGQADALAAPAIQATLGDVATSYRKKAKRTGEATAPPPALPSRGHAGFKLASPYEPAGDQPKAIAQL